MGRGVMHLCAYVCVHMCRRFIRLAHWLWSKRSNNDWESHSCSVLKAGCSVVLI